MAMTLEVLINSYATAYERFHYPRKWHNMIAKPDNSLIWELWDSYYPSHNNYIREGKYLR